MLQLGVRVFHQLTNSKGKVLKLVPLSQIEGTLAIHITDSLGRDYMVTNPTLNNTPTDQLGFPFKTLPLVGSNEVLLTAVLLDKNGNEIT